MEERTCHDCVYCAWDLKLWLRTFAGGRPCRGMCANHPDTPGTLREIPVGGPCRNFQARPTPPVRVAPPKPPSEDVRLIPLTRGQYAIVDATDYEWLSKYKWFATCSRRGRYYAGRGVGGRILYMHRLIMNPPPGMVVHHIDGNSLNNRRSNLRICTREENTHNHKLAEGKSSQFRGVFRLKGQPDKWYAEIRHKGLRFVLGSFDSEVEAARAYDRKAVELFKRHACLNFPEEWILGEDEVYRPARAG
jgi:hypothetical protein